MKGRLALTMVADQVLKALRPFILSDLDNLARLIGAAGTWPADAPPGREELIARWQRRHVYPEHDVNVLPGRAGELAAYTLAHPFSGGSSRLSFEIGVHPDYRCRGIGTAVYNLTEEKARNLRATHITAPVVRPFGLERFECARFLEKRGFRCEFSYWQMRLDNIQAQPGPNWPAGISVRRISDTESDAKKWADLIVRTFNEAATPGGILAQLSEPGVSPDGYFFAVDSTTDEEVGTSRARIDHHGGGQIGYIGTVGVLPEYRRRGIATALMAETLQYLADQGMESAILYVNDSNQSARELYANLGWRPTFRTDHYWKSLVEESQP